MPRRAKGLTAAAVQKTKVPGRYFDGDGLVLTVRGPESKFWSLRYRQGGKLREMGLGPAVGRRAVSLAAARRQARDYFDQHKDGDDPLATKQGSRSAARANAALSPSFEKAALDYIEAHRSSWSNQKHAEQWTQSFRQYVFPRIGALPVADIVVAHVESVLLPIWNEKPTTARRIRGRIERVLGAAKAKGLREGENPARWLENLDALLPKLSKNQRVKHHHKAMSYSKLGDFMTELRAIDSAIARALEYTILTCARSNEVLSATWREIDWAARLWRVPPERMKAGIEHEVPLSERAIAILRQMQEQSCGEFIFQIGGSPLPKDEMLRLLQRDLKCPDATVHGMRSAFADWRAEQTRYSSEVAEAALAHTVADKVKAAYQRTDFFDRRRQLMDEWSEFCAMPSRKGSAKIVAMREHA